jgi:Domain of unknown function (DUF6894)
MPRYFFAVQGLNSSREDNRIGKALPDIMAALAEAERMIKELHNENGCYEPGLSMLVKDEAQRTVLFLPFVACGD